MTSSTSNTGSTAVRASDFLGSIGINTHIDFSWTTYANTQLVESSINYLGVKYLRDSADSPNDVGANGLWQQVANATGAVFDDFMPEGSPASMQYGLTLVPQLAQQHLLDFVEGGNEEDDPYAAANGNSLAQAAQFQQQVYATGQQLGLPVINMSFGQGWATSPTGDYGTVGNLSAYANYANAHTYFGTGNTPGYTIGFMNSAAQLAASTRPVITTEMGWYTTGSATDTSSVSEAVQAKYMLDGLLDAYKAGDVKTYLYELLDQANDTNPEDNFGLFRADGSAKPAAVALHDLTTLLADNGTGSATFAPGALSYSLTGMQSTDNSMLMEKSDGSYWLAIWDETRLSSATSGSTDIAVPNHTVTLTLASGANITMFDPLTGTTAVQTLSNASTAQISLPDHPILVEITGGSSSAQVAAVAAVPAPALPPPLTDQDLVVTTPASVSTMINGTVAVAASISDAWAQQNPGTMALTLSVSRGTLSMGNGSGQAVAGSGTNAIQLSGTLAQLNAALATLNYQASTFQGGDVLDLYVWNQGGVEVNNAVNIAVSTSYAPTDLSVTVPAAVKLGVNNTVQVTGVDINDNWAAHTSGTMALNLGVSSGTLTMLNSSGQAVTGSGTSAIHISGTFAQLNAELATLSYHAPTTAGAATLSVNVWNQAGVNVTQNITVSDLSLSSESTVIGTSGNDILNGVIGSTLRGNGGADTFYFTPGTTGNTTHADHIADFSEINADKIDLHGFGLNAANFVGTAALSGAKSFDYAMLTDASGHPYTLVKIDTNGDHQPDYEVRLDNVHTALHASDFMFA